MPVKSGTGRVFGLPNPEEETAIRAGIQADSDTLEFSDDAMKQLRPVGRPAADITKQPVSIRLSPDVVAYFKATGKGWQTRIDAVLRDYVESHSS